MINKFQNPVRVQTIKEISIQKSIWVQFIESDESGNFNIIFRIGIGSVLLPHGYEELRLMRYRIIIYEEHAESMSSFNEKICDGCLDDLHYIDKIVLSIIFCEGYGYAPCGTCVVGSKFE